MTEVQAPGDAYTKANPFTFTIKADYEDKTAMKVTNLTAAVSESDKGRTDIAFGTLDGKAGDHTLTGVEGTGTDADAGEVTINVGNAKSVGLPTTGLDGVTLTWVAVAPCSSSVWRTSSAAAARSPRSKLLLDIPLY